MRQTIFAIAFIVATSLAARADTLNYTLVGGGETIAFSLSSTPTPDLYFPGNYFGFYHLSYTLNGVLQPAAYTQFGAFDSGGETTFRFDGTRQLFDGPILFTGSTSAPSLLNGVFALTARNGGDYTLTVTDPAAVVTPEPSSIVLLGSGLICMAGIVRRSVKKDVFAGE